MGEWRITADVELEPVNAIIKRVTYHNRVLTIRVDFRFMATPDNGRERIIKTEETLRFQDVSETNLAPMLFEVVEDIRAFGEDETFTTSRL